jgi:hypothetical protein
MLVRVRRDGTAGRSIRGAGDLWVEIGKLDWLHRTMRIRFMDQSIATSSGGLGEDYCGTGQDEPRPAPALIVLSIRPLVMELFK